jgi:uncharacterized protein YgiM (DUF1202 family)
MKYVVIFIVLCLQVINVQAGPVITTTVEKVRVRQTVSYVKLADCTKYNRIYLDTEYGRAMFSTALTAKTAGKEVRVEFVEDDGCETIESEFIYFELIN